MRRGSRAVTALVLAALALLTAACGVHPDGGHNQNSSTIRVAILPSTLFAPLYVAQARGYFAREGVTVKLQVIKSGADAIPLAASGRLDCIVAGFSAGMFSALDSGLDFRVVGSMGRSPAPSPTSPTTLAVPKDSDLHDVADLRGKKVALAGGAGTAGGYQLGVILQRAGLTLKDVRVVNLDNADMKTALGSGGVDAALVSAPFSADIQASGFGRELAQPPAGTVGTGIIFGGGFTRSLFARHFFAALAHGARDLQGDRAASPAITSILAAATKQKPAVLAATRPYTWLPDLAPVPSQLDAMQRIFLDAGLLQYRTPIPTARYVDDSFARAASRTA